MYTGKRDTLVSIERRSVTRDSTYGSEVVSWSQYATAWVELTPISAAERDERGVYQFTRLSTMELPMIYGIDTSMRVRDLNAGKLYQITGIRNLPKNVGLVLEVSEYSTSA